MRSPSGSRSLWWSARHASPSWRSSPMGSKRKRPSLRASDGSVLIQVLWTLAILVLLSLALGYTTALDQRLVSYQRDRLTALYLAKAGYQRALVELEDRPFKVLEELWLVDGMTHEVFQALQPFVTVYSDGKVNLNTAPREVLMALGMSEGLVAKVLRFRWGFDGIRGTRDDQSFATLASAGQDLNAFVPLTPLEAAQLGNLITQSRLKVASSFFRIHSLGTARDGKISRVVEGIVRRGAGSARSVALVSWHES